MTFTYKGYKETTVKKEKTWHARAQNDVDCVLSHSLHKRRWYKILHFYYITPMGHAFLSFYDGHEVRKVERVKKNKDE